MLRTGNTDFNLPQKAQNKKVNNELHEWHEEIELRMTPAVASAYAKAMADKKAMAGKIDEYDLRKTGKQWLLLWVLFFFLVSGDNLGLYV